MAATFRPGSVRLGAMTQTTAAPSPTVEPAPGRPGRTALLECRGVCKRFGPVQALTDVDFDVYPGEVVALVGDNGAGKSTLIKAIAGIEPADAGTFSFDGVPVAIRSPGDATRLGIETVYQDLALCDNLDTAGNLFLGREPVGPARLSSLLQVARRARDGGTGGRADWTGSG